MEGRITLIAGEDIPDDMGRPREDTRRPNQTATTNTRTTERPQPMVNFGNREQHRRTTTTEVQQTLMNYSTNNNRANNANVHPDCHECHQWPRNNERNWGNHSSASSEADSTGH